MSVPLHAIPISNFPVPSDAKSSSISKIAGKVIDNIEGFQIVNLCIVPYRIKMITENLITMINAKRLDIMCRALLNAIAEAGLLVGNVFSSIFALKLFKVIKNIPSIPWLQYIFPFFSGIKLALEGWDACKMSKAFSVIKSGSKKLQDHDGALQQLTRLKTLNLKDVQQVLGLSKQCKIAARVDSLIEKVQRKVAGSLDEVKEFYKKMNQRVTLKFSLSLASVVLSIISIVGEILFLAVPFMPLLGSLVMGMSGVCWGAIQAYQKFLLNDDIFDPNSKCLAVKIKEKIVDIGIRLLTPPSAPAHTFG